MSEKGQLVLTPLTVTRRFCEKKGTPKGKDEKGVSISERNGRNGNKEAEGKKKGVASLDREINI